MLVAGTQMHLVTFLFVCIEIVILFYLTVQKFARPDDHKAILNITLISLLILYNLTGGMLPDPELPGSYVMQTTLAYSTGFLTPAYFPYYVFKAFGLERMHFHAYKGVFFCLVLPFVAFASVFASTQNLGLAQNLLFLPMAYAIWVIFSLYKAIRFKHEGNFKNPSAKQERIILLFSLTPWVGLPLIDWLQLGQALEATITNLGFLSLFALHVKEQVQELRNEHLQLIESQQKLKRWNANLQAEVDKRTKELARINEEQMNTFINLAHETKTPLTIVSNYVEDYMAKHKEEQELTILKVNLDKLSADIVNLFDVEKFKKGFSVYDHNQVTSMSDLITETVPVFRSYAASKSIRLTANIESGLHVKADPHSINRIVNNLLENAIKFCSLNGLVHVSLKSKDGDISFSVKDNGPGVSRVLQARIFEPYFQIASKKKNVQGMGLGLPIVKMVVSQIGGSVTVISEPVVKPGTELLVTLPHYMLLEDDAVSKPTNPVTISKQPESKVEDVVRGANHRTILLVEDNVAMLAYLTRKLGEWYNVYAAIDGHEAIEKLNALKLFPDLIICDIMMDRLDGYGLATAISGNPAYDHIPLLFITAKSSPADRLLGLKLGALDVIQKPFLFSELFQKVRAVFGITDRQRKALLSCLQSPMQMPDAKGNYFHQNCKHYQLTSREKDVAELVCKGYRYKAIGETLFISEKTVAKHIENIFAKVGATNKIELINKLDCHQQAQEG